MKVTSKKYDLFMIGLIIVYTLLVLIQLSIDDSILDDSPTGKAVFFIIELVILGIFIVDISLHSYAFGELYLKDPWNISDILVIALSIVFVCLDLMIKDEDNPIKGILKLRGVFRLLRIFIMFRKLNTMKAKRDNWLKKRKVTETEILAPIEKVIFYLEGIRDSLDFKTDQQSIEQLNYCLRAVK